MGKNSSFLILSQRRGTRPACRATREAPGRSGGRGRGEPRFSFLEGVGEAGEGDLGLAGVGSFNGLRGIGSVLVV